MEAGGEGGSAGLSLWRLLIWRRMGRVSAWPCVLVNACYYHAAAE